MIKELKDLEHDLELIEAKNMKILCKNMRYGRVWQCPEHASNWFQTCQKPERQARVMPAGARPCTMFVPFLLFCFKTLHNPCYAEHGHAKVPDYYFVMFSYLKAHGLLAM